MSISRKSPVRGIDHLVIAAKDLDRLAAFYRALGFTVGARNAHPWGTRNHIVQFDGAFLELIGVGDGIAIPPHNGARFSFGAFVRDFLTGGDGMAMLALESTNAVADAEIFRLARIGAFEPFFFERKGTAANGAEAKVSFTLAFADMPKSSRAGFFVCQQHQPHNFWNVAAQRHDNGVLGILKIVLVTEDPSDTHEFLGAFTGQREMRATSYGLELATARGSLTVLSPVAFSHRYGCDAPPLAGNDTVFAAVDFRTSSRDRVKDLMNAAKIPFHISQNRLVVRPGDANGVALTFSG